MIMGNEERWCFGRGDGEWIMGNGEWGKMFAEGDLWGEAVMGCGKMNVEH